MRSILALGMLACGPTLGVAQASQLGADLARQRTAVLRYLDAAPDSTLGYRPTAGVRSFAEQVEHIGLVADLLSAAIVGDGGGDRMAPGGCGCLGSRATLRSFVETAMGKAIDRLTRQAPASLSREATFFGVTRSRLAWFGWISEHTAWTLGQVVPYLRLNGVSPPGYLPI